MYMLTYYIIHSFIMDSKRREISPRKSRLLSPIKDVIFKFLVIGDYGVGKYIKYL